MFTIEKGIPVPPTATSNGRPDKYPFAQLENGDSFFVPATVKEGETAEKSLDRLLSNMRGNILRAKKQTGFSFAVRVVDGNGVRVWRTA